MNKLNCATVALLTSVSMVGVGHAVTPAGAKVSAAAPGARADLEVFLPLRNTAELEQLLTAQQTVGSTSYHKWLTPAQFGARFGPTPASVARVTAALSAAGLHIDATHTRSIHVSGTAAQINKAFGTSLNTVVMANGRQRMQAATPVKLPTALQQEGVVIAAFNAVPPKHTSVRKVSGALPDNRYTANGPYYYNDMKQAYDYPSYQSFLPNGKRLDGTGVSVAVLMETDALDSDVAAYFNHENFTATTGSPPPTLKHLAIDGGSPFDPNNGGSYEASLDVQQVLGGAPGASVTLVSIPDLYDNHILDGYVAIVDGNKWDVVNSSFGGCELGYTPAYNEGVDETGVLKVFHEVFEQGNAQGITFVASSGDEAGLECPSVNYFSGSPKAKFVVSVSNPADDPNVTAVGGGNLHTTPPPADQPNPPTTLTSKYVSEDAKGNPEIPYDIYGFGTDVSGGYWGAGGGRSVIFAMPTYQNWVSFYGNSANGRIIPDIGMQVGGCPGGISEPDCPVDDVSYVITVVGGVRYGLIGTSVASPEFVGALSLAIEAAGHRLGNVNPFLWSQGYVQMDLGGAKAATIAKFYHKDQGGYDGHYHHSSTVGFDYMYGNGSPFVRRLFGLTAYKPAGDPQTPSNP